MLLSTWSGCNLYIFFCCTIRASVRSQHANGSRSPPPEQNLSNLAWPYLPPIMTVLCKGKIPHLHIGAHVHFLSCTGGKSPSPPPPDPIVSLLAEPCSPCLQKPALSPPIAAPAMTVVTLFMTRTQPYHYQATDTQQLRQTTQFSLNWPCPPPSSTRAKPRT